MRLFLLVLCASVAMAAEPTHFVAGLGAIELRTDIIAEEEAGPAQRKGHRPRPVAAGATWAESFVGRARPPLAVIHPMQRQRGTDVRQRGPAWLLGSELMVRVEPGTDLNALARVHGVRVDRTIPQSDIVVMTASDPAQALAVLAPMRAAAGVQSVDPDLRWPVQTRYAFDDPLVGNQWHHTMIGSPAAWPYTRGANVLLAVVDSGVEMAHEDLSANIVTAMAIDPIDGDTDPNPDPAEGISGYHGTWVAGVASAVGNNGIGVVGVAPESRIAPVRLITGSAISNAQFSAALGHGVSSSNPQHRVGVSNNSWGLSYTAPLFEMPESLVSTLNNGVTNGRNGRGIIYVWACGNDAQEGDDSSYDIFASNRFVLAVGSVDNAGAKAPYSEPGSNVLVSAPGGTVSGLGIVTTDGTGAQGLSPGTYTATGDGLQGTSFAAPVVAGVCALMVSADPTLTRRDVMHVLAHTSTSVGSAQPAVVGSRPFDHGRGFGIVDAGRAVAAVRAESWLKVPAAVTPVQAQRTTTQAIPDNNATGITQTVEVAAAARMRCEWVELTVNVTHTWRGDLSFELTSPSGRQTRIGHRHFDSGENLNWTFTSVAHWGEPVAGTWSLRVVDNSSLDSGMLNSWSVRIRGYLHPTTVVPAPMVSAVEPAGFVPGSPASTMVITGSGFRPASRVFWGATELTMTYVNGGQLEVEVPSGLLSAPILTNVTVETLAFLYDGGGTSSPVSVRVGAPPSLVLDETNVTFAEDTSRVVSLTVADVDDDVADLVVTGSSSDGVLFPSVSLISGGSGADRTLTIAPLRDRNGSGTVTVTVSDGWQSASADITVTVTAVDDPPQVEDIVVRVNRSAAPAVASFTGGDADGDALTYTKVSDPDEGSVVVAANGVFTWTPPLTIFTGVTSFTAKATANGADSPPARATIIVRDPNQTVPWIVSEPVEEIPSGELWTWNIQVDRRFVGDLGSLTFTLLEGPATMSFGGLASTVVTAPGTQATLTWTATGDSRHVPIQVQVSGDANFNQGFDHARVLLKVRGVGSVE